MGSRCRLRLHEVQAPYRPRYPRPCHRLMGRDPVRQRRPPPNQLRLQAAWPKDQLLRLGVETVMASSSINLLSQTALGRCPHLISRAHTVDQGGRRDQFFHPVRWRFRRLRTLCIHPSRLPPSFRRSPLSTPTSEYRNVRHPCQHDWWQVYGVRSLFTSCVWSSKRTPTTTT